MSELKLDDLDTIKILGNGAFGDVSLVEHKTSKK